MKHVELENLLRQTKLLDGQPFSAASIKKFSAYYQLVLQWNARLHLTTLTDPRAFLQRHLLESVWLTEKIEVGVSEVWDIGSGLGVPGIIVAISRPDLAVFLVEANQRKSVFLEEVGVRLGLTNLKVVGARFQEVPLLAANTCLTARALERMEARLGALLKLASNAQQVLLLGNEDLKRQAAAQAADGWKAEGWPLPDADHRWLINLSRIYK